MSGLHLPSLLLVCPGAALVLWVGKTRSFPCNTSRWGSAKFLPFGEGGRLMASGGIAPGCSALLSHGAAVAFETPH